MHRVIRTTFSEPIPGAPADDGEQVTLLLVKHRHEVGRARSDLRLRRHSKLDHLAVAVEAAVEVMCRERTADCRRPRGGPPCRSGSGMPCNPVAGLEDGAVEAAGIGCGHCMAEGCHTDHNHHHLPAESTGRFHKCTSAGDHREETPPGVHPIEPSSVVTDAEASP